MYIKAWCLLHHIEVNGKVLLMLVPRGIWDRAGHFKGTASLFLMIFITYTESMSEDQKQRYWEGVW